MIKSMTGYGRAQELLEGRDILVEIKSVNHRYFEFSAKTPRACGFLDEKLKALAGRVISRGKVEVNVSLFSVERQDVQVSLNTGLARDYVQALRSVGEELSLTDDLSLSALARLPEIFTVSRVAEDEDVLWEEVRQVAEQALARFVGMRAAEGDRMLADISGRLRGIAESVGKVEEQSPRTVTAYRERLAQKLYELLENRTADEQRILTEAAIFADKIAVDEETVRLRSHIRQFEELLASSEPVGRKLDFLVQEMNREVNTIGSKCQDLTVTGLVLSMKAELEKIREQIQNIE